MRLAELHVYSHELPVKGGSFAMANARVESLSTTLVKLVTNTGIVGWGETCPVGPTYQPHHAGGARAAIAEMGPGLVGEPIAPLPLRRAMEARLNGHGYAKAAIEIAALDAMGRALGVPVSELMGGRLAARVPSYFSSPVGEVDDTVRLAADAVRQGYPRLQVKVGKDVAAAHETVRKVFENVGTAARLTVDVNRGWPTRNVLLFDMLTHDIPLVLEQPCESVEELAAIRTNLRHPVYLDESTHDLASVLGIVGRGLVDGFGLKVTRLGGPMAYASVRDVCRARQLPHSCDDAWGGDIIAATCAHLAATVEPRLFEGAWIAAPWIDGHYDERNGIRVIDGHIAVPTGPGLGVVPDEQTFGAPIASFT